MKIDDLAAVLESRYAEPTPWVAVGDEVHAPAADPNPPRGFSRANVVAECVPMMDSDARANARKIVAAVNHAPALLAVARALEAILDDHEERRALHHCKEDQPFRLEVMQRGRDALAALEEVQGE